MVWRVLLGLDNMGVAIGYAIGLWRVLLGAVDGTVLIIGGEKGGVKFNPNCDRRLGLCVLNSLSDARL